MIANIVDVKNNKMGYVHYSIQFKKPQEMDKKAVISQNVNTHIPLYDDVYGYLIGLDEIGIKEKEADDVAEIKFAGDSDEYSNVLFDIFTVVFVESSGHTCVEIATLFDILLHITSNHYSSFILYDNDGGEITETPRFVITK